MSNRRAIDPTKDVFEFDFEVKKVIYTNPKEKFAVLKTKLIRLPEDLNIPREMNVRGTVPVAYEKDVFRGKGVIEVHEVYGRYIRLVEVPEILMPQVEGALMDFIRRRVRGVGKKKSERIVKGLGLDCISKIEKDHTVLLECGFSEKEALRIQEELTYHKRFEELIHFLQSIHIEVDMASEIYDELQQASVAKIRTNPYVISKIGRLTFLDADRIARSLRFPPDFRPRYRAAILYYLDHHLKNHGDICVRRGQLIDDFSSGRFLSEHGSYPEEPMVDRQLVEELLDELIEEGAIVQSRSRSGDCYLYTPEYFYIEENIIKGLQSLMRSQIPPFCSNDDIDRFIAKYEKERFPLADKQKAAVYMALNNRLSILTGGPGTGKTATTNVIVQFIHEHNPKARVKLLAPTGKAAKRLSEMTGYEAMTIHRGLGLRIFGKEKEIRTLDEDFVIVDEFSMTDAYLFNLLINHVGDHTRLVLIGDYHQLPSVGPGLILRDLIHSGRIPVTELTEIFRQARESQLVVNAHKMQKGMTTKDRGGLRFDPKKGDSYFVERTNPVRIQDDIIESMKRFMKKGYTLDDFLVLSPMHHGILGTIELNRRIQREFNPPNERIEIEKKDGTYLRVGDRVMQTENNYELEVFNGEIGTIEDIYFDTSRGREELVCEVTFPDFDEPVVYREKDFDELELAYCITIHKSQGSEAPIVIMPIHSTHRVMLDRVLLYTGYTRTQDVHIFIGSEDLLNESLQRVNTYNRQSLIVEKIRAVL